MPLPTKVCLVKAMVLPVIIYGCESWTIKKAELQRTDAFLKNINLFILIRANYFTILYWFCHTSTWICHRGMEREVGGGFRMRIDAFELWCWRRLLRVPWTARRSNQSVLKEISPEYSLEGLMLKLKLQYVGHLMWRTDSLEKTLMLGKIEVGEGGNRGWDGWMASPTQWTWVWVSSGSWWWTGRPGVLQPIASQRVRHNLVTE